MTRLLLLMLLVPTLILGQTVNTTEQSGQRNIYNDAFKRFINFTSKTAKTIFDTMFIMKDDLLTDSLQVRILKTVIQQMETSEISAKIDRDISFVLHKIYPLSFDKGQFFISIVPFGASKENEELILGNSGGCNVFYSFNSEHKRFDFIKVSCSGF